MVLRYLTPLSLKEKNKSEEILKLAVKRMLPGGPLAKKQLTKLKIYSGENILTKFKNLKLLNLENYIEKILLDNGKYN